MCTFSVQWNVFQEIQHAKPSHASWVNRSQDNKINKHTQKIESKIIETKIKAVVPESYWAAHKLI